MFTRPFGAGQMSADRPICIRTAPGDNVVMRWLVDGMNVIGTRPDRWWRDRDAAMLRLVDQLERWAASEGEDVIVVFERPPRPRSARP